MKIAAAVSLVLTAGLVVACAGGGGTAAPAIAVPSPTPSPTASPAPTLVATPSSIVFGIAQFPPAQQVVLSGTAASGALTVSIADPTLVGVSPLVFVQAAPPTYGVMEIARGTTTITFGAAGTTAVVSTQSFLCGRPDVLINAQLLYPRPGSAGNATGSARLYFAATIPAGATGGFPEIRLHLSDSHNMTLEGGPMTLTAPPPGAATPAPVANGQTEYLSSVVPALAPGVTYRTQLYDDACQPAVFAGNFST